MSNDDVQLMLRAQRGDEAGFEQLFLRYRAALLRVARSRLPRDDDAEDVVQETFLSAYRSRATFDPRYSFRTWLWTILLNQCRRWTGRQSRRAACAPRADCEPSAQIEPVGAEPAPLAALLIRERAELVDRLLRSMRAETADALRLRFFGGLKFQEIADAMDCSLGTAKNRVKAGLLDLSARLAQDETIGPAASGPTAGAPRLRR